MVSPLLRPNIWHISDVDDCHSGQGLLQWCNNGHCGVSNNRRLDCLLDRLFRRRLQKTSKLRHWRGESTGDRWFPSHRASNAENVYIWWRLHAYFRRRPRAEIWIVLRCTYTRMGNVIWPRQNIKFYQYARLPVMNTDKCNDLFHHIRKFLIQHLSNTFTCVNIYIRNIFVVFHFPIHHVSACFHISSTTIYRLIPMDD